MWDQSDQQMPTTTRNSRESAEYFHAEDFYLKNPTQRFFYQITHLFFVWNESKLLKKSTSVTTTVVPVVFHGTRENSQNIPPKTWQEKNQKIDFLESKTHII